MNRHANQRGVAHVLLAIVLVAVAAGIVASGYYVYRHNQQQPVKVASTAAETKTTKATTASSATGQTAVDIKQWGVHGPQATGTQIILGDTTATSANLLTADLMATKCWAHDSASFRIERYGAKEYVSDTRQKDSDDVVTAADMYGQADHGGLVRVGNYYYVYVASGGPCAGPKYDAAVTSAEAAFKKFVAGLTDDVATKQ